LVTNWVPTGTLSGNRNTLFGNKINTELHVAAIIIIIIIIIRIITIIITIIVMEIAVSQV
jgi:hypothetical protein